MLHDVRRAGGGVGKLGIGVGAEEATITRKAKKMQRLLQKLSDSLYKKQTQPG